MDEGGTGMIIFLAIWFGCGLASGACLIVELYRKGQFKIGDLGLLFIALVIGPFSPVGVLMKYLWENSDKVIWQREGSTGSVKEA